MLDSIFKSFSSLFEGNTSINNENLNQGKLLLNYENDYKQKVLPHLKPLQTTTSKNLSSIIETLENNSGTSTNSNVLYNGNNGNNKINDLENKFNQKLTEYSNTYKSFIENLISNSPNSDTIRYHEKVVVDKDKNYIYINDYGFTHKYLSDDWKNNDSSCPNTFEPINDTILKKFNNGPNMGSGQACKIAGQNIKNSETNEVAWVDIKGFKHIYPNNVWNNKKNSCNINPIILSSKAYNNIPSGPVMENNSECLKLALDPVLWNKLQTLNGEIVTLASELLKELNNVQALDTNINKQIKDRKIQLDEYIKTFEKTNIDVESIHNNYNNIVGQEESSYKYTKSAQYNYIMWLILALLILLAIFRSVNGEDNIFIGGITIIILLFMLYYILKILY